MTEQWDGSADAERNVILNRAGKIGFPSRNAVRFEHHHAQVNLLSPVSIFVIYIQKY